MPAVGLEKTYKTSQMRMFSMFCNYTLIKFDISTISINTDFYYP